MTAEWSDRRPAGWPSEQPVWAITALVLAAAMIPALLFYQYRQEWTAQGVAAGDKRLVWYPMRADHAKLHQFLQHWIYADHSLWDLKCWRSRPSAIRSDCATGLCLKPSTPLECAVWSWPV